MFETATEALDWIGIIVFAITGALVASRKEMDVAGFVVLGTFNGAGGGTIRDVLLSFPVFWVREPSYLITCVFVLLVAFFTAHIPQSRYRYLLWLDADGLALFAVAGTEKAMQAGIAPTVAVAMGVITVTFGGIIQDLLGGEIPVILSREIYASAALSGAVTFVVLAAMGAPREPSVATSFATSLFIRAAALHYGWSLTRYRPRPGLPHAPGGEAKGTIILPKVC